MNEAKLASRIGMTTVQTKKILNLKEQRENLGITKDLSISSVKIKKVNKKRVYLANF